MVAASTTRKATTANHERSSQLLASQLGLVGIRNRRSCSLDSAPVTTGEATVIKVVTDNPDKWRFVDLETREIFKWNQKVGRYERAYKKDLYELVMRDA